MESDDIEAERLRNVTRTQIVNNMMIVTMKPKGSLGNDNEELTLDRPADHAGKGDLDKTIGTLKEQIQKDLERLQNMSQEIQIFKRTRKLHQFHMGFKHILNAEQTINTKRSVDENVTNDKEYGGTKKEERNENEESEENRILSHSASEEDCAESDKTWQSILEQLKSDNSFVVKEENINLQFKISRIERVHEGDTMDQSDHVYKASSLGRLDQPYKPLSENAKNNIKRKYKLRPRSKIKSQARSARSQTASKLDSKRKDIENNNSITSKTSHDERISMIRSKIRKSRERSARKYHGKKNRENVLSKSHDGTTKQNKLI